MLDKIKQFAGMKGFRKPKKLNNEQLARQQAANAFSEDYKAVCAKHSLQLRPIIRREPDGSQYPDLAVAPYEAPKLKSWADATAENLEVQKKCRHLNENGENCKTCGVRLADQHESGTGVTETFIEIKEKKIADYRAKEAEDNKE